MDDRIFFGAFVYLFLSVVVVAILPASLFSGSSPGLSNIGDGVSNPENIVTTPSYFSQVVRFMLASWTIDGIPTGIGLIITLLNIATLLIAIIFVYDKVRGIGG